MRKPERRRQNERPLRKIWQMKKLWLNHVHLDQHGPQRPCSRLCVLKPRLQQFGPKTLLARVITVHLPPMMTALSVGATSANRRL
jgi:hypothetical protein